MVYKDRTVLDIKKSSNNCNNKIGNCCISMLKEAEIQGNGEYDMTKNSYKFNLKANYLL